MVIFDLRSAVLFCVLLFCSVCCNSDFSEIVIFKYFLILYCNVSKIFEL